MEPSLPAEQALQLLFNKLHPHLEDAAHALAQGASPDELTRLHLRLIRARFGAMEALEAAAEQAQDPMLSEILDTLAANLTPVGENYQQALTLTQLCLEEAPADLLPFTAAGSAGSAPWGKRMAGFLARLEDPAFQARERWRDVDPDIGDDLGD